MKAINGKNQGSKLEGENVEINKIKKNKYDNPINIVIIVFSDFDIRIVIDEDWKGIKKTREYRVITFNNGNNDENP